MKTKFNAYRWMAALFTISLLVASCSNDDSEDVVEQETEAQITLNTINDSDEVDMVDEELTNIALDIYASDEAEAKGFTYDSDFLPDCVVITTVVTDTTREKTIDFGEGCTLPNGNFLTGKIILSFEANFEAPSRTLMVNLEDFTFNEIALEGNKTIIRTLTDEGNPIANKSVSLDAVWPDGNTLSYSANKTREWIEGFATGTWADNVFLLDGVVNFTNIEGVSYSKEIVESLRREWACRFIVSGVLEVSREDVTISLDFGDGSCDPFGTLTRPDGTTQDILLRRFL